MSRQPQPKAVTSHASDCAPEGNPQEGHGLVLAEFLGLAQKFDILLEPPSFPEPVISMAVEPRTTADQEKMSMGLGRLLAF